MPNSSWQTERVARYSSGTLPIAAAQQIYSLANRVHLSHAEYPSNAAQNGRAWYRWGAQKMLYQLLPVLKGKPRPISRHVIAVTYPSTYNISTVLVVD